MLRSPLVRFWTTQSIAAMTCETSVSPDAPATLMLTIRASGAMPANSSSSGSCPGSMALSRPAMIPARWVPCPYPSTYGAEPACRSNERSGPLTTLPSAASPSTGATPESISATSTPRPVTWSSQAWSAPIVFTVRAIDPAMPDPPQRSSEPSRRKGVFGTTDATAAEAWRAGIACGAMSTVNPSTRPSCRPTSPPRRVAASTASAWWPDRSITMTDVVASADRAVTPGRGARRPIRSATAAQAAPATGAHVWPRADPRREWPLVRVSPGIIAMALRGRVGLDPISMGTGAARQSPRERQSAG